MRIVVLVKEVPDTYGERKLDLETGLADRGASDAVLDEIGERALEAALTYADANEDAEVILLSMAPESSQASLRRGLAMGAHSAVHVTDSTFAGADLGLTAEVLTAALQKTGFDLVIAGDSSTDGSGGVIPAMLGELLEVPCVTAVTQLEVSSTGVHATRISDDATVRLTAPLPAVVSVTEALPAARFPNFKGIMAAKKKTVETLSASDLSIEIDLGSTARSIMFRIDERPPRSAGARIVDEGDAGIRLADFLVQSGVV